MKMRRLVLRAGLLAPLALLAALPTPARAATEDDLRAQLQLVQGAILDAATDVAAGDTAGATQRLTDALTGLTGAQTLLADADLQAAIGKALNGVTKAVGGVQTKVEKAQLVVVNGKLTAKAKISNLKATAKSALVAGLKLGKPVFAEIDPRTGNFSKTAGFHKPGDVVNFQIYGPDGLPCTETPEVSVQNGSSLSQAIDLNSVSVSSDGLVSFTMGAARGGGNVTVTACGHSSTLLVYNYGPPSIPGVPDGFPTNLPTGNYLLSYSASGDVVVPPTSLGVIPLVSLKSFAKILVQSFQAALGGTDPGPDCTQNVGYTGFDGSSFAVSYAVFCDDGMGHTSSETTTFTLTKQ